MCIQYQLENLNNTKRLGRYNNQLSNNNNTFTNNNNTSNSLPSFRDLAQFYKDNTMNTSLLSNKSPNHRRSTLERALLSAIRTIEKSTKFINKIKSRQLACASRAKSIPGNATIRKEYIRCGKQMCEIEHGPYYYAYWKDHQSKKLKKKYIGDHMPENKESSDDSTNNLLL